MHSLKIKLFFTLKSLTLEKLFYGSTLASQSRFDPNWAVVQDLELELKSKLEPKLES